jgi:primosomal protein N'
LIQITVGSVDEGVAGDEAEKLAALLRRRAGAAGRQRVLGPGPAPIYKMDGICRHRIYVKVSPQEREGFEAFMRESKEMSASAGSGKGRAAKHTVAIDVNPYSTV